MTLFKTALVTGATRGIGFETARQLAQAGVHVFLAGRDASRASQASALLQQEGLSVDAVHLDVLEPESIERATDFIAFGSGKLDILINNAAIRIEEYGRKPSQQPIEQWRQTFETNLFGAVSVTKSFLPSILRAPAGRIVNVSSLLASLTTHSDPESYLSDPKFKSVPAYSASKSALNSWTVHLAYELRETPVKVNAVHPGYTKTDMNGGDGDQEAAAGAKSCVLMALLDSDGPTGSYVHMGKILPW